MVCPPTASDPDPLRTHQKMIHFSTQTLLWRLSSYRRFGTLIDESQLAALLGELLNI